VTDRGDLITLVPKSPDPVDEAMALEEEHGWEDKAREEDEPQEWHAPEEDADIRWVNDAETGVMFFEIEGPGRKRVAEQIEAAIPMLGLDELDAFVKTMDDRQSRRLALFTVGTLAPAKADRRVTDLLTRFFADEDPVIRSTALMSASMTRWPEFKTAAKALADDPDENVRRTAQATLKVLDDAA
jgi:hypothetical protein